MRITTQDIDKRICDVEEDTSNTETFREFIRNTEEEFNLLPAHLTSMNDEKLNEYLDFLDELWNK